MLYSSPEVELSQTLSYFFIQINLLVLFNRRVNLPLVWNAYLASLVNYCLIRRIMRRDLCSVVSRRSVEVNIHIDDNELCTCLGMNKISLRQLSVNVGCEPISIWTLIRHGKRSPGTDYSRNMLDALVIRDYVVASYMRGNSSLCAQDVENLRNWEIDTDLFENAYGLTDEGYQEILGIGRRLKAAYSELLSDLEDGSYTIRSAYAHWVEDGVDGFVKGVANKSLLVEKPNPQYDIMAPYEACSKYVLGVKHNPKTYNEAEKYLLSPEYVATKQRIQKRLGIQCVLTDKNITALYDLCRYTWPATDNKGSPWCALFTKEDLIQIEYHNDLRHYYRNGYGTSINEKFGQIAMADLYKTFVNAKANNNRKLTSYFSHATMMDMVYSALGLYKDKVPLTSAHRDPNRKWRSTMMAPFASNIIAELNRCSIHNKEDYKIIFYSNEEPLTSMCENGVCSWQKFENKFRAYLNTTIDFCFT